MAADSAKKTVQSIATDTSSSVVKAISKDLADDATAETAKDVDAAKAKADAEATKETTAAPDEIEALVPPKSNETAKNVAVVSTPADSKSIPIQPASVLGDKTVSIEINSEATRTVNQDSSDKKNEHVSAPPVSLKITIGADGEVKAVSKEVSGDEKDVSEPSEAEKVATDQTVTSESRKPTDDVKEIQAADPKPSTQTTKDHLEDAATGDVPLFQTAVIASATTSSITKEVVTSTPDSSSSKPSVVGTEKIEDAPNPVLVDTTPKNPESTSSKALEAENGSINPSMEAGSMKTERPSMVGNILNTGQPVTIATVASIATTTKTTTTKTTEVPENPNMVTISQQTLDHLHLSEFSYLLSFQSLTLKTEIDTMHEAIQEITKLLALHLPSVQAPVVEAKVEDIAQNLSNDNKPSDNLAIAVALPNDQSQETVEEDSHVDKSARNRATAEKQTSMLDVIGKVLWPFGSPRLVDVASISNDNRKSSPPNLIKAPTVTTSEIMSNGPEIVI